MRFQTEAIFNPDVFEHHKATAAYEALKGLGDWDMSGFGALDNPRRKRRRSRLPARGLFRPVVDVNLNYQLVPRWESGVFAAVWTFSPEQARALRLGRPLFYDGGMAYYGKIRRFSRGLTMDQALETFREGLRRVHGMTPWVKIINFGIKHVGYDQVYYFLTAPV